ncbi:hypothetical protein [Pseudoxanthomonas mexicana]|nr:hypothetical protein [Pseudoxanthomonas mexicana]
MLDLFVPVVPDERQHPIFRMLLQPSNAPERAVIDAWASGFVDRCGKFTKEFQTTFESSFWELYVHAALRASGAQIDFSHASPDFVVSTPTSFVVEATIAGPAQGQPPAFGPGPPVVPTDLNEFNRQAILRLCNSLSAKSTRFLSYYAGLPHVKDKPFVIALAPFDRPSAHLASHRALNAALYGVYDDEEATLRERSAEILRYDISSVSKHAGASVPVGLFTSTAYRQVSAVVYSALATWGKVRALADAPERHTAYQTLHPNPTSIVPRYRVSQQGAYREHLLDGLYVAHNPYADYPLPLATFDSAHVARFVPIAGRAVELHMPADFLLWRQLWTLQPQGDASTHRGQRDG